MGNLNNSEFIVAQSRVKSRSHLSEDFVSTQHSTKQFRIQFTIRIEVSHVTQAPRNNTTNAHPGKDRLDA